LKNQNFHPLLCFTLICTISFSSVTITSNQSEITPYWYSSNPYRVNSSDYWLPFFSYSDVPEGLPLRGYSAETRNWFIDLGAFEWFSDWVQNVWEYNIPYFEENFTTYTKIEDQRDALENIFSVMSWRLSTMGLSVDYAKNLTPPFEAWIPMVVMDNLTVNGYATPSNMSNWIIRPDIIESVLNEAFPLIEWRTDLYWYDWEDNLEFSELVNNKTEGEYIMVDEVLISHLDTILYNILSDQSDYDLKTFDVIFPSFLFLIHEKALYYPNFGPIGGLGHIQSQYSDIASWQMSGRNQNAYFYGGDPTKPRNALTTTVLHELGHCVGLPHPHDVQYDMLEGGWILDTTTISTMTYYSRSNDFDQLDKDIVLNSLALQLWGRYQNEVFSLDDYSLNITQQTIIDNLKSDLLTTRDLLRESDVENLKSLFTEVNSAIEALVSDLGLNRSEIGHYPSSYPLSVRTDFILGGGFISGEQIVNDLKTSLKSEFIYPIAPPTVLPTPHYNLYTDVHYASVEWQKNLTEFIKSQMTPDITSYYDPYAVSPDAWIGFPRQEIFHTIEGYSINGSRVENWLENNPVTPTRSNQIQYRFYIFNLNQSLFTDATTMTTTKKTPSLTIAAFLTSFIILSIARKRFRK
jgi:hypothetical protein